MQADELTTAHHDAGNPFIHGEVSLVSESVRARVLTTPELTRTTDFTRVTGTPGQHVAPAWLDQSRTQDVTG